MFLQSPKSCQKCEKLENELASLKISHDTIAKRNAELSSKMRALSENELTGPKINSAPSVSGSFHTFGYPTPSSLGTAAANEEIRETGKFNVSSNGLAESSIFNFDGANDLLLQQSETRLSVGQFKQVQGELHLAQENFKRMKSFYIQEKKLNERLQQTAKEILNMNLKSEDKVSALQEQLRQSELENQRLQDRLDAYLSLPAVANISTAQRRISTSAALSDTFLQQHSSGSTTSPRSSTLKLGTFSERRSRVMTNAGAQYYPDLASTPRPYNSKHSNAPMSEKALGYTVAESSASTPSVENKLKVLRDSLDAEMAKSDKLIAAVDRSVT